MQKLIAELEERYRIMQEKAPDLAAADNLHKQAAAALREDAGTIADLRADNARLRNERDTIQRELELISIDNARLRKAIKELRCGCLFEDCYTSKWRNLCSIGTFKRNALEGK